MMRTNLWITVLAAGCAAPESVELFNAMDVEVTEAEGVETAFVEAIESATTSLRISLADAEDEALLQAIAAAHDNGLDVQLIVDLDNEMDLALQPLFDIGVPITLATNDVEYFDFAIVAGGRPVFWPSTDAELSHSYVVTDEQTIVTATTAGHERTGDRILFTLRGEEIVEDWLIEHNQIFGGLDATALTAFSSPAKSIADFRWRYGTGNATDLEVWFGPQERITKRVTDAIYMARSRVWVMTDDLANEGIFAALESKFDWGFDVRILTGPNLGQTSTVLRREYDTLLAAVDRRELLDVEEVPTLVLIDPEVDNNGFGTASMALVLTHDLYNSARFVDGVETRTDQLTDGVLLVLSNRTRDDRADIERLASLFEDRFEQGVPR